ncbi:hypothetical protein D3C80_2011500 [compost metagenome]
MYMNDQKKNNEKRDFPGLGIGLFILVASVLTLGEYLGFIPKDLRWGLPTIGIIWGLTMVVTAISNKR